MDTIFEGIDLNDFDKKTDINHDKFDQPDVIYLDDLDNKDTDDNLDSLDIPYFDDLQDESNINNAQKPQLSKNQIKLLHSWDSMPYRERAKISTKKELTEKLKKSFQCQQIETISKIYFDFIDYIHDYRAMTLRGSNRTFVMAGTTLLICNDINLVCTLFPEITLRADHKNKIINYSTWIKSTVFNDDYYDDASRELAERSP
jgi:hypothetical protein